MLTAPDARDAQTGDGPLAIICGGGTLPLTVADAVTKHGRRVVLLPVRGWADPAAIANRPHHWIAVVQAGRLRRLLEAESCRDIVFIGAARRPPFSEFRLDWFSVRLLPRILASYRGGDDNLLSGVARLIEEMGFRLVASQEVAPEILVPEGPIGRLRPSQVEQADVRKGLALLAATGPFDVGQAVVVIEGHIVAVEGAEGTDQMLVRVAELRRLGRIAARSGAGILVKAPKPSQDRRFDLPAIGPQTVVNAARAGLAGIVVIANETLIAEPQAVALAADQAGLFVVGINGGAVQ